MREPRSRVTCDGNRVRYAVGDEPATLPLRQRKTGAPLLPRLALAPGVYFVREAQAQAQAMQKVVVTR